MNSTSRSSAELNRNQKEAINYSRKLFEQIERIVNEKNPDGCLTSYRLLNDSMQRMSGIDKAQIETILSKARQLIEPTLMQKIEFLLEKAMEASRQGDIPACRVYSKLVKEWNDKCKVIIINDDFWDAVYKQLEIISETTPRGTSEQARKNAQAVSLSKNEGVQHEKRRYLRYLAPAGLTVKFPPQQESFQIQDISMEGMMVIGHPKNLEVGKKIQIEINLEPEAAHNSSAVGNSNPEKIIHRSTAQVMQETEIGFGIFFEQLKGPILYLIKERHIDLNRLEPSR